ncbi:MAG: glycoside hydrolase family 88 protein [Treponema sp.]|jgi:unsaturated chondroitin disaccharide hydrolase|nr:glycoside hydrolase family 88 protein [Treponema sp.]
MKARKEIEALKKETLFSASPKADGDFWRNALGYCSDKIRNNIAVFKDSYPAPTSVNGIYPLIQNTEWTSAFWPGMLYLAFESTGDELFLKTGESLIPNFRERLDRGIGIETHDLGFLYTLSCVAPWRLRGNTAARETAILAADLLLRRYHEKAGVIQAWGNLEDPAQRGRVIIDCAMNLPLLYWASGETGDPRYREMAARHINTVNNYIIRENWSSYHTYFFDTETGAPLRGNTAQGYSDDSCWARGQAWGIYGNALSYRYLGDPLLLENARGLARYFLNRLPEDLVAYWDLVFVTGAEERDSSAAAIAACGLLELSAALAPADPDRIYFQNAARHIAASLAESYTTREIPESTGLLLHGVYSKPGGNGVDECTLFGDYFYTEALMRLCREWKPYW